MKPDLGDLVIAIYNDCWPIRYYAEQRTAYARLRRAQAIKKLGLTLRHAFNTCDEFEALLGALIDGLSHKPNQPF